MKKTFLFALALVVIGCGPEPIDLETLQVSDDEVWLLDGQAYSGRVYRVGRNDYLLSTGSLKNGKMDGKWDFYASATGSRVRRGTYKDGVAHGPSWTAVDGKLKLDGSYKDGERCGEWVVNPYEVLRDLQDGGTAEDAISGVVSVLMDEARNYPPC